MFRIKQPVPNIILQRGELMDLKNICLKSIAVFVAVFVIPLGIFYYTRNFNRFSDFAAISAGLVMGKRVNAENVSLSEKDEISNNALPPSQTCWDIDMAREETETPAKTSEIPSPLPAEDVSGAIPYPDSIDSRDGIIENFTYGYYDGEQYFDLDGGGQVRNCTEVSSSELYNISKKGMPFELDKNSDEPQILIYHTHATESFEPYARDYYDSSFSCKTTERNKNIISVGDKICEQLDNAGIAYVHDTLVHDYPSYDGSYQSSRAAVEEILKKYPSIKICLDIHRDGIEREDGTRIAPVTEIDGREAAQIMIISCCDDGSGSIPNFLDNFQFASQLQSSLESDWQGLTRPILFDCRFYNQDLTTGSLLIEVGSHGNSLDQAQYSGELIGKTLVKMFEKN